MVRQDPLVDDVFPEDERHLVGHEHPCPLVRVVVIDDVLGLERVVFGVFASPPVARIWDGDASCPAMVLPSPGLVGNPVFRRELSERDPAASPDERVPVGGENLPSRLLRGRTPHILL